MTIRLPAAALATLMALALTAPSAQAEDGIWKTGTGYVIRFEKLDLTRSVDRQILLAQVESAASRLCEGERTKNRRKACVSQTLASVQAKLDAIPKTVGDFLALPAERMLFTGMAIGHADPHHALQDFRAERAPLDEVAEFIGL